MVSGNEFVLRFVFQGVRFSHKQNGNITLVASFVLEPLNAGEKNAPKPRTLAREEMAAMVSAGPGAGGHHDEHDDEPVPDPTAKQSR